MLEKLVGFVVGREPVAVATGLAGGVGALIGVLMAFDVLELTPEQIAAVAALVTWAAGYAARRVVTPVAKVPRSGVEVNTPQQPWEEGG